MYSTKYVRLNHRHLWAKQTYYAKLINKATPNQNWDVINKLTNNHKPSVAIKELIYNDVIVTKPIDIANTINQHFSSIGTIINDELKQTNPLNIDVCNINANGFKLQPIDVKSVADILKSLPNNKQGGVSQIPTFICKIITPYISKILADFINGIINQGTFPDIWKQALITPLKKPGDPTDPSNRRPISSLPILSSF